MIPLLYATLVAAFVGDYQDLADALGNAGRFLPLLPELCSGLLFVGLLLRFAHTKRLDLAPKYVVIGSILLIHVFVGVVANSVAPGTVVAGIRDYFRYVPLFLLPMVLPISELHLKRFFLIALGLTLLQVPISIFQRIFHFQFRPSHEGAVLPGDVSLSTFVASGDLVRGTLPAGSMTSMLLIFSILILVGLWMRGELRLHTLLSSSLFLVIPTFINETKGTILIFAVGVVGLSLLASRGYRRLIAIGSTTAITALFVVVFAAAYDHYFPEKYDGMGFLNFYAERAFTQEYRGVEDPRKVREIARIDSLVLAHKELSRDPIQLAVGKGIGNVAHPGRADSLRGEYSEDYFIIFGVGRTTYTNALWETGWIGNALILLMIALFFSDARLVAKQSSLTGAIALGWAAVLIALPVGLLWKSIIHCGALVVLLMFLAGHFAAVAHRLRTGSLHTSPTMSASDGTIYRESARDSRRPRTSSRAKLSAEPGAFQ